MDKNKLIENISVGILCVLLICARIYTVRPVIILKQTSFFIATGLIGLALSLLWLYILYRINRSFFTRNNKRIGAIMFQVISIVISTIFLTGFYNYQTGKRHTFHENAIVLDKGYYSRTGAGWFNLNVAGDTEKIDVRTSVYHEFDVRDTIDLTLGKGGNGFSVILNFDSIGRR